jgi:hypothetical protein
VAPSVTSRTARDGHLRRPGTDSVPGLYRNIPCPRLQEPTRPHPYVQHRPAHPRRPGSRVRACRSSAPRAAPPSAPTAGHPA